MFVRTQFDTIVNLSEFQKIKIEWHVKQPSGNVFHTISAVSEEYSYHPKVGGSIDETDEVPLRTYKSETLAQFREDMKEKAEETYNDLFTALLNGEAAFDLKTFSRRGRRNQAEKFREATTLEERKEIGRKIAELRINEAGSKGMAWWKIRKQLGLKHDAFHEVIRLEDHFKESMVERIESFEYGWDYNGILERHLGFKPEGELLKRIEARDPAIVNNFSYK